MSIIFVFDNFPSIFLFKGNFKAYTRSLSDYLLICQFANAQSLDHSFTFSNEIYSLRSYSFDSVGWSKELFVCDE